MGSSVAAQRGMRVDTHLLKFSQAWVVGLTALACLVNQQAIVVMAAAALALSALVPELGPFRLLYRGVVVPLGLLRPRVVEDDPAPHRFAQGVGAAFLVAASVALLLAHASALGWALDLVVLVLAGVNFSVGFCAGCFVYYQLGRLGLLPRVRYAGGFRWRGARDGSHSGAADHSRTHRDRHPRRRLDGAGVWRRPGAARLCRRPPPVH